MQRETQTNRATYRSSCTPEQIAARGARAPINLALQGGGVHGAFCWGVLDRLLEDDRLALDAISATSAGAMNAAVMAWGVSQGGRQGARTKLAEFWREVSRRGEVWGMPWPRLMDGLMATNGWPADLSPGYLMFQAVTHTLSPYQLNPLDLNPLRDVLESVVDFRALQRCPRATRLFVSATNVRTGKIRVFENHEITADAVLASACLPYIFKAVEIDGEAYWDGGFMGNPAIFPLIYSGASRDVIIVHINPLVQDRLPRTAPEIFDRMNEITFNSSLMREMRAIAFVSRLVDEERLDPARYQRMLVHAIADDDEMRKHGAWSKLNPDWAFITHLFERGRAAATRWLDAHAGDVGKRATVDIGATYL
ncbi:MAG: patatin-like phospholipase family protein [Hyphomicrobiaceae bacterium]|nr:patatin-like phospholipase family protein [Hyphomicrobiaceae bacterium]